MWWELEEGTTGTTATGDGGDDGEFVGVADGGCFFFREVAEVFVVEVDVDEGAELAFAGEKLLLKLGKLGGQRCEDVGDGAAGDADRLGSAGVHAERCGDVDVHALPFCGFRGTLALTRAGLASIFCTSISMPWSVNLLSSSLVPMRRNELVMEALPCSTEVMT